MEIKNPEKPAWLDPSHPNYERWQRSRKLSADRGRYVLSVINKYTDCRNLRVLDLGSGEGGTSEVLSENNIVVSFDLSMARLQRQRNKKNTYSLLRGDAMNLPFRKNSFDLIIIQDVIEHVGSPKKLIERIDGILRPGGFVYLSTPNKLSFFNLIADPHWGMPFISVLKRPVIKKYFLKYFRKSEYNRPDAAQLLSYKEIERLLHGRFTFYLNTKHSVERLLNGDKGIVWSDFHLRLLKVLKKIKAEKLILKFAEDNAGILNKYFNPTFYLVLKKQSKE